MKAVLYLLFIAYTAAYDAQVAGLYYGVNNTDFGFQVLSIS